MKYIVFLSLLTNALSFKLQPINYYSNNNLKTIKMSYKPVEIIKNINTFGSEWTYNEFVNNLNNKNIDAVTILDNNNYVIIDKNIENEITQNNIHLLKGLPQLTDNILDQLLKNNINFDVYQNIPNNELSGPLQFGLQIFFGYLILSFLFNLLNRNNFMSNMMPGLPNQKNNKLINNEDIDVRFNDVAGCDESKYELMEVVDFLKKPEKYKESGAKIPSGILLEGPPGTGKTLLARAVAGEAGVGFISASGSEFIEMFVGVGASRVRNIFKLAEENKPCVIFIDEIDAIGRQRGTGFNSGNDEREQTLNQILTNMDGFDKSSGIIVLAATNRADILDSALTRPGRFDRKVVVPLPDKYGREALFNLNLKDKNYDKTIDVKALSELTSGFSGAEINNLVNEAAILSVRKNKTIIDYNTLYSAFEKITIGLPKENDNRNINTKRLVAYHEAGHALIAKLFSDIFDLRKITINANYNGAGGYTLFTQKPNFDGFPTKKLLLAQLMVSLGGRAAESILYQNNYNKNLPYYNENVFEGINNLEITTGASNDLKQADSIARSYISLFGFNDTLTTFDTNSNDQPFLGRDLALNNNKISEYSKNRIDKEVNRLLNFAYEKNYNILKYNNDNLEYIANTLLNNTSVNDDDLDIIVNYY